MKKYIKQNYILLLTIMAAMLSACEHKPLYTRDGGGEPDDRPYGYVRVNFDWSELEDPSDLPEGIKLYAFDETGGKKEYILSPDFNDYIKIPTGVNYLVFAANDNDKVDLVDVTSPTTCEMHYIGTRESEILPPFYGGVLRTDIKGDTAKTTMVLSPRCKTKHIDFILKNSDSIMTAPRITAAVTGLANKVNFLSELATDKSNSMRMSTLLSAVSATELNGGLRTLGVLTNGDPHQVIIAAYWIDGTIRAFLFEKQEITDKVNTLATEHRVTLEFDLMKDGVEISYDDPLFPKDGNGITTTIDDFQEDGTIPVPAGGAK